MKQDPILRERFDHATDELRFDVDASLARVRRVRARRSAIRRAATIVTALLVAASGLIGVWLVVPEGDHRAPFADVGPAGTLAYMVVTEDGGMASLAATTVGSPERAVLGDGTSAVYPVWSPDGTRMAYGAGPDLDHPELTVANADGSEPHRLGVEVRGPFSWSPDGARLAYIRGDERPSGFDALAIISADGSDDHVVLPGLAWQSVSWSPDGERLLLTGHPESEDMIAGPDGWDVYSVRVDGTDLVQLTSSQEWEHFAIWSPRGERIVFTRSAGSSDDADYTSDVWVMAADGSDARRLTDWRGFDSFPAWSPDGEWIAFASDRGATPEEQGALQRGEAFVGISILLMRADGSDVRPFLPAGDGETLLPASWRS